ncbi:MAG TPA: hypothetical protein VIB08_00285 [Thermoanaerobaculia bacterium]
MRRALTALVLVLGAALAVGCNKAPAEAAMKSAEQAVEAARAEATRYVPDQFQGLEDALSGVRVKFGQRDYAGALKDAQAILPRAQEVVAAAAAKKEELTKTWNEVSASLPVMVGQIESRVAALTAMKRLPKGIDKAALESASAGLARAKTSWTEATSAFQGGDLNVAIEKARAVKAEAEALMGTLGITTMQAAPAAPAAPAAN